MLRNQMIKEPYCIAQLTKKEQLLWALAYTGLK